MAGKSRGLHAAVGAMGVGIVGALGAIGVESVKSAAKFQTSMTLIETQAGQSRREVDRMSKAVLGLSGKVATAPEDLAKGLYHLESAGFHGKKALDALTTAAKGAKMGGADLESVTNALNATLVSGIKGAQDMSAAMGALNATVGAGDMRMQDLADALGTGVLASVKGFGLSLNDVGAALATFGDNNIRGADAATQLRMAVLFMAQPAKTAKTVLKDLGMTTHTLADDMRKKGLGGALEDLHKRLVDAGDTGAKMGQVLVQMFGHKAGTGIAILEQQLGRFESKQQEVQRGSKNFASDWTAYTKTFGYSWDRARAAFESMTIQLGEKLLPVATKAMNWIGTKGVADLDKFGGWVSRNKRPIEDIAKALAAIAAFRFASSKLSQLSRLLGFGAKSLGGTLVSKAEPVPVYVTNWAKGGLPGGGGAVSTVEKDAAKAAEGGGAVAAARSLATRMGPLGKLKATNPLVLAYVATQGGDVPDFAKKALALQASNVTHGPYKSSAANMRTAAAALKAILGGEAGQFISQSQGHGYQAPVLHTNAAIAQILSGGTKSQVQDLKALAKVYPDIAKGVDTYEKSLRDLNKLLVIDGGLAKNTADAHKKAAAITKAAMAGSDRSLHQQAKVAAQTAKAHEKAAAKEEAAAHAVEAAHQKAIDAAIRQLDRLNPAYQKLAAQATSGGHLIGVNLDNALVDGLSAGEQKVIHKAAEIGAITYQAAAKALLIRSPSKKFYHLGEMSIDGLTLAIGDKTPKVLAAMQRLVDKTLSKLDTLKGKASGLYNGIVGNLEGGAGFGNVPSSDSFGAPMAPTVAGIFSFKQDYLKREQAFARNLALLRKKGLQAGDVAQIAGLGLDQGGPLAQSLAGASAKQLHQLTAIDNAIAKTSRSIGSAAEHSVYGRQIAEMTRAQRDANHLLKLVTELLKRKTRLDESTLRELAHLLAKMHIHVSLKEMNRKSGQRILVATL